MQDQFNLASLAKLSNSELQALLATLTGQFHAASSEAEQISLHSKIETVKNALARWSHQNGTSSSSSSYVEIVAFIGNGMILVSA